MKPINSSVRGESSRWHRGGLALAVMTVLGAGYGAAEAQTPPAVSYACAGGAPASYTVPDGFNQLYVVAAGGAGGTSSETKPGRGGAVVYARLPVGPGESLIMMPGCAGEGAADVNGGAGGAGYGNGGNGGANSIAGANGAGGGGGSAILDAMSNPRLVAGGAGGNGGNSDTRPGGPGGKGSKTGGNGVKGTHGGTGGKGGTAGQDDGADGFHSAFGGSGGGGGGGHGATKLPKTGPPVMWGGGGGGEVGDPDSGGGGGGGGGASFAAVGAAMVRYASGGGPRGNGFIVAVPTKPWKPTPAVSIFGCKTGKPKTYTVAAGVEQIQVIASGAGGGTPFGGTAGAPGARITATLPVSAGQHFKVVAGCHGQRDGIGGKGLNAGAAGDAPSPPDTAGGAGGGGSSAVLAGDGTTPLIVASGGDGGDGVGGEAGGAGGGASSCDGSANCDPIANAANAGDGSVLIVAVRSQAVTRPDPPTDVVATLTGLQEVTVSFTAPADTGNRPITTYTVTAPADGTAASGGGSPLVLSGLTPGGLYVFVVTATSSAGTSVASAASNPVQIPTTPGPPSDVSAVAGNGAATVSFTASDDDGNSPITGYTVTAVPGGQTASGPGSPITVTGLTNGTAYTFEVLANNALGAGPAAASNPVTPAP